MADGSRGSRVTSTIAKLAVTAGVIAFIIQRLGWRRIAAAFSQADYRWVVLAVAIFVLSNALGTLQWLILLRNRGIAMRFGRAFMLYFVGMFFNNFLFGTVTGDAIKVALIKSGRDSAKAGLAATFLERFAGLMAMAGFAVAGSAVLVKRGLLNDGRISTAMVALAAAFLLFCAILVLIISRRVQRVALGIAAAIPMPKKHLVLSVFEKILLEVEDRHIIVPVGLLSILIQFLRIVVHMSCAASLGLLSVANFQYFFVFVPVLAMLMVLPLPFGVKEGIGASLFLLAGIGSQNPEATIVMQFLASLVGIAASLLGAPLFVAARFRTSRKGD